MKKLRERLKTAGLCAMLCILGASAWADAPTPAAVWDGNFEATQTGYTLNLNGNSLSSDKTTITIDQSVGVKVDFTTALSSGITVMFKYSNLNLSLDSEQTMVARLLTGKNNHRTGVYLDSSCKANGVWDGKTFNKNTTYGTSASTQATLTSDETAGVMAFTYHNTGASVPGTRLYRLVNGTRTALYVYDALGSSSESSSNGIAIGGNRDTATNGGPATGMKITGIAIFNGTLTEDEMTSYIWPSAKAAKYDNWNYATAGRVVTWETPSSVADIHSVGTTYRVFDTYSGMDLSQKYTDGQATSTTGANWHYFFKIDSDNPKKYVAPGSVIRLVESNTFRKSIGAGFSPLTVGGIIVESGASDYDFTASASNEGKSNRGTIFGAVDSETWFGFDDDFKVDRQGGFVFLGTVNLDVNTGKALTIKAADNSANNDGSGTAFVPVIASDVSIGTNDGGSIASTTAGGTLKMHGAGSLVAENGLNAAGATLDFSDIGSRYNDETPFINSQLTVDANTIFVLPDDITLPYTYKVATSISAGGATPSATWTDTNGNVFTHAATVNEANGTITVNLANATEITVNGALTINGATAADITVNAGKTLTLDSSAVLSGTVTGEGSVAISNSVNLSSAVFVRVANLYLTGSSLTFGDGVEMEVTTMLRTTHAGASACSVTQTGGSLTCSGPANDNYKLGAFVLSHWGAITTYTLSGGTLTVNNSTAKFGADGTGNMTISGTGIANFHSLSLRRGTLTVGAGGTLNLGADGQTSPVTRTNEGNLTLNGGTLGSWNSSAITIPVPVTISGNSTIRAATASGAAANITFTGAITGAGNLTITGGGSVVFAGDMSGYTGSFAVQSGTLGVPSGSTVTSIAEDAEVVVLSNAPSTLEAAISGGYALSSSLTVPESVAGTISFVDSSLNVVPGASSTWENGVRSFTGTAPVNGSYTGNQWVWDYEFNGNYVSIGSDTSAVNPEGDGSQFTATDASGNQELYFQKTPYRSASFSSYTEMTAVMYCAPGNYPNTPLVGFGTKSGTAILLATGASPANGDMVLYLNQNNSLTPLATMKAVDATTKKHLYAFVMDRITEDATTKTRIRIYLDGKIKAIYKHSSTLAISDGFQIGSVHGGIPSGLTKYSATGDSGTLDFLRVKNAALSDGAMAILANTYPYESAHGEATRDPVSGSANTWVSTDAWTQTVPGADDETQNAPNADTNVKLSIDGSSAVSVALNLETDSNYESLTFTKEAGATGSLKITSGYQNGTTGKLVSAETSVLVDTTVPAGRVNLGITSVGDGVTLTVDPYSQTGNYSMYSTLATLPLGGVYEDQIISMAILGEGANVTLASSGVTTLANFGFTATLVYNESNQSYAVRVVRESSADVQVDITTLGTTWMAHNFAMPVPETLTLDAANTVAIYNTSGSAAEISTAFAGGNVTVAASKTVYPDTVATSPVVLSGAITTSGNLTFNGATTLSGTSTISGAVAGSGTLTVSGDVTVASTGSIANTIAGDGTITFAALPASALSFGTWTGTVVLPELDSIAGDTFSFNSYGVEGSTVRVNGIGGGWLRNEEVNPTIDIPADKTLTISDFSASFNNTFKALSGAGTFAVTYNTAIDTTAGTWYSTYSAYFLIKNISDFTGSLSTATTGIAIGASKPYYTTAGGTITLTTRATIATGKTWTATGGIVLADAAATLTNTDGALDPAPTTTVANKGVRATESDGVITYTVVPTAEPGVSVEYDSEDDAAAAAAVAVISVPSAVTTALNAEQLTAYKGLFEAKVTPGDGGKYVVSFELTSTAEAAIHTAIDTAFADPVVTTDGEGVTTGTITVDAEPGLYYAVETSSTAGSGYTNSAEPVMATGSTLDLAFPMPASGVLYYRVKVTP